MSKTGIKLKLVGEDGNAFAILGRARAALWKAGKNDCIDAFTKEATSGTYDNLLRVCCKWFEVS